MDDRVPDPARPDGAPDRRRRLSSSSGVGATLAVAGDTLGYDFRAYHQAAVRAARRPAAVRHELPGGRRVRAVLLPADVRAARPAVRAGSRRRPRSGPGPRCCWRRSWPGVAILPVIAYGALVDRPAGGAVVAVRVRGQARPGGPAPVPAVRHRLALAGRAGAARGERGPRGRDQAPAGADPRLGGADPALGRGRRRAWSCSGSWRSPRRCWPAAPAWSDFLQLVGQVGDPITTAHNVTPGRGRLPAGRVAGAGVA